MNVCDKHKNGRKLARSLAKKYSKRKWKSTQKTNFRPVVKPTYQSSLNINIITWDVYGTKNGNKVEFKEDVQNNKFFPWFFFTVEDRNGKNN